MPDHSFFRPLGLFTRPGFLTLQECDELRNVVDRSEGEEAKVYSGGKQIRRDDYRKTFQVRLKGEAQAQLHNKIEALRPELESCFELTLGNLYETRCLIYRPGDFFELHIDSDATAKEKFSNIAKRQVSVVIFLNDPSYAAQTYTGGVINFHGLMDVPGSSAFGFPLDPETGLLVAFRSTILHGVATVEEGKRYSFVTWFH